MVKTISKLPKSFTRRIEVTLNDQEFHVVARNAIIFLFSLTALEAGAVPLSGFNFAKLLIHFWYSASLPNEIITQLVSRVKPLLAEVCGTISAKAAGEIVDWTWHFSRDRSLRLALKKEDWLRLEALCEVPPDLTQ